MHNEYYLWIIFTVTLILVMIVIVGIRIDCNNRADYWNTRGLFIDCWDCNTGLICDYPEIPKVVDKNE